MIFLISHVSSESKKTEPRFIDNSERRRVVEKNLLPSNFIEDTLKTDAPFEAIE